MRYVRLRSPSDGGAVTHVASQQKALRARRRRTLCAEAGNWAVLPSAVRSRPLVLRPHLAMGLPFATCSNLYTNLSAQVIYEL